MNIKDLKEIIGNQPDDAEVHLYAMLSKQRILLKVGEKGISLPIEY